MERMCDTLCWSVPASPAVSPLSSVPRVVAVSPQMRLVEDNPSSLSLVEIYKQRCAKKGIEHDNPISRYYDRLATVQARGTQASHQVWAGGRGVGPCASAKGHSLQRDRGVFIQPCRSSEAFPQSSSEIRILKELPGRFIWLAARA